MSEDSNNAPARWRWPIALIAVGLLVWGSLFALGAYLDLGSQRLDDNSGRDWMKGLIVLGCTLAFLAFWGLLLWNRSRRLRWKKPKQSE